MIILERQTVCTNLLLLKVNLEELDLAETLLQEVISNYPNSGAALLAEQDLIKLNPQ